MIILTPLQREIQEVLTGEWQTATQIEHARRARGGKPMTPTGIRRSCESLRAKFECERRFHGVPWYAAKGTPRNAPYAQQNLI